MKAFTTSIKCRHPARQQAGTERRENFLFNLPRSESDNAFFHCIKAFEIIMHVSIDVRHAILLFQIQWLKQKLLHSGILETFEEILIQ